jgi:uncharacterized protein (TIGR03084 family)
MDMHSICDDLQAELTALDAIVSPLREAEWNHPTPAENWLVRDQISHIGSTDRVAVIAAGDPERFQAEVLTEDRNARHRRLLEAGRAMSHTELLNWWRDGYTAMLEVFRRLDAKTRIPWFGPAMSAVSFATARLMETWAHGQDIVDALGLQRTPTDRLRHVATIGVLARPFSYRINDREPPTADVRVELTSPSGVIWTWGDPQAPDRISGDALDFCLIVTQRRHPSDTGLHIEGVIANGWMQIAQAFAGAPGSGRAPGQFK